MSREAFGIAVSEQLGEIRNKALSSGVPKEQLEEIITSVYGQTQDLSLTTAVNRIKNALLNKIDSASATTLVGVLVGSRDRTGTTAPIKYCLVKKDKQHVEVSNFGTTAQYQGEKIEIPVPALVELKARHNADYDSWELKEIVSYRPIDKAGLEKVLSGIVIPIKEITKEMAYAQGRSAKPVVISGEMNYLRAEVVFKPRTEENEGQKAEIDHSLPVLMPRELTKDPRNALPCFQFSLKGKNQGANSVRCHLSAMRHGTPTILVTDIETLAARSVEKYRNDPEEQAKDLNEWLKESNVLVVGTVSTFKKTYTEDKSERNYVDIAVSCVIGVDGVYETGSVQKPLSWEALPSNVSHITVDTPPIAGKIISSKPPAVQEYGTTYDSAGNPLKEMSSAPAFRAHPAPESAPAPQQAAPQQAAPQQNIAGIAKMIKVYCRAAGIKPNDVSLELLKAKALDIVDGVPDAVVIEAMGYLKATTAALGE